MKILFVILGHNKPRQIASLCKVLIESGSDTNVAIHFDAGASEKDFVELGSLLEKCRNTLLVRKRVRGRWGSYNLVQAVVNSLTEAMSIKPESAYDYVILLSGTCLPNRSIKQLERYLDENRGREFIEVAGPDWITDGLRNERYQYWFPFSPSLKRSRLQDNWVRLQRLLKVQRMPPNALEVRYGSQWWALSGLTCKKIIKYLDDNPSIVSFFKNTYIPDEMVFPTLVNKLVDPSLIAGHNLTTFHFSQSGKPVVFHDDHISLIKRLDKFFFRKASVDAEKLREACYSIAGSEDDLTELEKIGQSTWSISMILDSQNNYPRPGQIYYRSSYIENQSTTLQALNLPYIVFFGKRELANLFLDIIKHPSLKPIGNIFSTGAVDFWKSKPRELDGLNPKDHRIRDLHPAAYLNRVRSRVKGVPIICWSPGDRREICTLIAEDPNALCILALHDDTSFMEISSTLSQKYLSLGQDNAGLAQRVFQIATQTKHVIPQNSLVATTSGELLDNNYKVGKLSSKFSNADWLSDLLDNLKLVNSSKE